MAPSQGVFDVLQPAPFRWYQIKVRNAPKARLSGFLTLT